MSRRIKSFDKAVRPPIGRRRELWDTSIFLFLISFVGYILTTPPPAISTALAAPLVIVTETELGWIVAAASLAGIVASYWDHRDHRVNERILELGYRMPRIAAWFMMANFLMGILTILIDGMTIHIPFTDWSFPLDLIKPDLTAEETKSSLRSGFLYALIFGWAARRLGRDNRAWWER